MTASVETHVRIFGIRHHGPGSGRSLVAALSEYRPTLVLIEGPSEAELLLPHLADPEVKPPIAMLLYAIDTPRWAAYYPFAHFSPEYQAIQWANKSNAQVRFIDLPASAMLGLNVDGDHQADELADMAAAAGFEDTEDWWEHLVEQRTDPSALFEGLEALMTALRETAGERVPEKLEQLPEDARPRISDQAFEVIREAHMRRCIREALNSGQERIAVVCGAWHAPALRQLPPKSADEGRLKGLPKLRIGATIVPWTYDRLTFESGYGAGARSPAFYELLWETHPDNVTSTWLMSAARLMRGEDLDASPASVIEAVRLADALAALRGRPRPGLRELCEAAGSVLIRDDVIWQLIGRRLIVGERLGEVPATVPMIPLQADLIALQKRLRIPVDTSERVLELDLRGDIDMGRSRLFHRLGLLDISWAREESVHGKKGTFHEHWRLLWRPELAISIVEASPWGNSVLSAATARSEDRAKQAEKLSDISALVGQILLADLGDAIEPAVDRLQALSATSVDVADLADALPPLAGILRYGTVRRTETELIFPVLDALFTRLCLGLPGACTSLDDEAAKVMMERLTNVTGVVRLFDDEEKLQKWITALKAIFQLSGGHALVAGKSSRLLFDLGDLSAEQLAENLLREASVGASALETAAFVEGLLDGPGAILIHQEALWNAVDSWVCSLDHQVFDDILPLIRRTFALFSKPERRQLGERVTHGEKRGIGGESGFDEERAARVIPIVHRILGLDK